MDADFLARGWSGFDGDIKGPDTPSEQRQKEIEEAQAAEADAMLEAVASCFRGRNGAMAIRYLRSKTIELACFDPDVPGENAVYRGFFREGQNSVIRLLESLIERAELKPGV